MQSKNRYRRKRVKIANPENFFPWVGAANLFDLFSSKTKPRSSVGVSYGDGFYWRDPKDNELADPIQPIYWSHSEGDSLRFETFIPRENTRTQIRTATLPSAVYIGGTAFFATDRVESAFESRSRVLYPDRAPPHPLNPTRVLWAVPVGANCVALQEDYDGSTSFTGTVAQALTMSFGPFEFGYSVYNSSTTTYANWEDDIAPIAAGEAVALYSKRHRSESVRTFTADSSTTAIQDQPHLQVDYETNAGGTGPPAPGVFNNNTFNFRVGPRNSLAIFEQEEPGGFNFGPDLWVFPPGTLIANGRYEGVANTVENTTELLYRDTPESFYESYLVVSNHPLFSDPIRLDSRSPREYAVSIEGGVLGLGEIITLEILSGGYTGPLFWTKREVSGSKSNTKFIAIKNEDPLRPSYVPANAVTTESIVNKLFAAGLDLYIPPGFTIADLELYYTNADGSQATHAFATESGIVANGPYAMVVPGVGAFDIEDQVLDPAGPISVFNYEFDRRLTVSDFSGPWVLVSKDLGKRFKLIFQSWEPTFDYILPSAATPEETAPTASTNGEIMAFEVVSEAEVTWDSVVGELSELGAGTLILYPEGVETAFDPAVTQLFPNGGTFTYTRETDEGSGGN